MKRKQTPWKPQQLGALECIAVEQLKLPKADKFKEGLFEIRVEIADFVIGR